jgi:hypothetical protein
MLNWGLCLEARGWQKTRVTEEISDWVYTFDFNLLLGRYPAGGKGAISEIFPAQRDRFN